MMHHILIKEVMVKRVLSARVNDSLSKVWEKMQLNRIRHIPVVNEHDVVCGLVTQRDLFRISSPHLTPEGYTYADHMLDDFILQRVMTQEPVTMKPDDSLAVAVKSMATNKYGCIIIVDDNQKIAGLLTETDVLRYVADKLLN